MSFEGDFSFMPETKSTRQRFTTIRICPRYESGIAQSSSTKKENENVPQEV